ncbi:MAG: hypothetical protein ACRDTS_01070 [Mycobacterium sp.]
MEKTDKSEFKPSVGSVRNIIEALILAGILWLGNSISTQSTAITRLQVQVSEVQVQLSGIPKLQSDVDRMQVSQAEHDRRIAKLESTGQ